ncbi:hypothetical protein C8J57DRAFT_1486429, partial [Mycena rebaudengoi]
MTVSTTFLVISVSTSLKAKRLFVSDFINSASVLIWCVVAGRLAYADPNLKVILIEGGANNRNDPWVYRPGIFIRNMQRDGIDDKATFYTGTMMSSHMRGRKSFSCANILVEEAASTSRCTLGCPAE